jgi:hypothetical protein
MNQLRQWHQTAVLVRFVAVALVLVIGGWAGNFNAIAAPQLPHRDSSPSHVEAALVSPRPSRVQPSAVWAEALHYQAEADQHCTSLLHLVAATKLKGCIDQFMRTHGPSAEAVAYFMATGSYLAGFVNTGPVDVGYTLSSEPMDCGCFGYVLLNGQHQYLAPPGPVLATPSYASLRQAYRMPSGGTGLEPDPDSPPFVESARSLQEGGEEIVFQFPLNDLCNACATPYRARQSDLISAAGAVLGSLSLGPCLGPTPPSGGITGKAKVREPACPRTVAGPPE